MKKLNFERNAEMISRRHKSVTWEDIPSPVQVKVVQPPLLIFPKFRLPLFTAPVVWLPLFPRVFNPLVNMVKPVATSSRYTTNCSEYE